jgi:hypothetical protein
MSELGKSLLLQAYLRAPCDGEQPALECAARSHQNPVGYGESTPRAPPTILRPPRSLTSTDAHSRSPCLRLHLALTEPTPPTTAPGLGSPQPYRDDRGRQFRPPVTSARGQVGDPTWDKHRTLPSAGGSHGPLRPDVGDGVPFGERVGGIADHFAVPSSPGADVAGVSPVLALTWQGRALRGTGRRDRRPLRSTFESRRRRGWGEPSLGADVGRG